jgi:uncharacterized protein
MTAGATDPIAPRFAGSFPGRAAIDAYGNGGFRFAGVGHRGSLLILPDAMRGWDAPPADSLMLSALAPIISELKEPWFLLLGTGLSQMFLEPATRRAFIDARIGVETMSTGAAARTFNVLLAEGRPVAALLLAV